jgi:thymidine phosphorylase
VLALGAGRKTVYDRIDHAVGLSNIAKVGQKKEKGEPLARIHANSEERLVEATNLLQNAFTISCSPVSPPQLILGRQ